MITQKPMKILNDLKVDCSWTLFLDRDGVINVKRDNDYVKSWNEFEFIEGSLNAINVLSKLFGRIIIVTNQQGIGKGIYDSHALDEIHLRMKKNIENAGGKIDAVYYCGSLKAENNVRRKPGIGMALDAKKDFPEINFSKSIIIGDSESDMLFGKKAGMKCVFVGEEKLGDYQIKFLSDMV